MLLRIYPAGTRLFGEMLQIYVTDGTLCKTTITSHSLVRRGDNVRGLSPQSQ